MDEDSMCRWVGAWIYHTTMQLELDKGRFFRVGLLHVDR